MVAASTRKLVINTVGVWVVDTENARRAHSSTSLGAQ